MALVVERYGSDFDPRNKNALTCCFRLSKVGRCGGKSGCSSGPSSSGLATCGTGSIIAGSHGSHRRRSGDLDAAVGVKSSILSKAIIAILAANLTTDDGSEIPRARRVGIGLTAALGGGVAGSVSFTLAGVGAPVRVSATDDGLVDGGTSHARRNTTATLLGIISSRVGIALRRIGALLSARASAADGIVDGGTGPAGTSVLAAVAHTEPSRLEIADGPVLAAVGAAGVWIVRLAGAIGTSRGAFGRRRAALRRRVASELGEAEVVVGALLGSAFQWLEAMQ